jgi:putative DNA primase/helicase
MVDATCLEAALGYAGAGCYTFPAKPGERKSRLSRRTIADGKNWGMTNNPDTIRKYWNKWSDSNVCIVTGEISKLFVVEVDTKDGHNLLEDGQVVLDRLIAEHGGEWPDTRICESPSGSKHYYFVWPEGQSITIRNSASKLGPGIDVRGDGGMVLAPPSIKPGGGYYRWISATGIGICKAPQWLLDLVVERDVEREIAEPQAPIEKIKAALEVLPNDGINQKWPIEQSDETIRIRTGFDGWNDIGMCVFRATGGSEDGYIIFRDFSAKNKDKFDERYTYYSWHRRWVKSPPTKIGAGTLFKLVNYVTPGWNAMYEEEHHVDEPYFEEDHPYTDSEEQQAQQQAEMPQPEPPKSDDNGKGKKPPPPKLKAAGKRGKKFTIKVRAGYHDVDADDTEKYLLQAKAPLYVFGHALVQPVTDEVKTHNGTKVKVHHLHDVEQEYLSYLANQHIEYLKYDQRSKEWVPVDPPTKIIAALLSKPSWSFPMITGVLTTPTMRPDGTLLTHAGYDSDTRLLLLNPPSMPAIPNNPTLKQVQTALTLLKDLLIEFPFADGIAKAVALSAIITPIVRGAFPKTPMHVSRAPIASSGKSYLFNIAAVIATGQFMPVMAAGYSNEETEKRLDAALLCGQPLICIDNVNGELGGDKLCQAITSDTVSVRVLGKTENRIIQPRGTALFSNGNNIALTGDVTRRCLITMLNPNVERPELREFKQDPIAMVLEDRGKYIAACLTICKGYMTHGSPNRAKRISDFEGWSDIVRSALLWLGEDDPVSSIEISRAEDPDLISHATLLIQWSQVIGIGISTRMTITKVIDVATEQDENNFVRFPHAAIKWTDFHEAVSRVASFGGRPPDANRLARWARYKKDKIVQGLVLRNTSAGSNTAKWWVEKAGDPLHDEAGQYSKHQHEQEEPVTMGNNRRTMQ